MTTMLHQAAHDRDGYQERLQLARLQQLVGSRAAATALAESYVGIFDDPALPDG
jgi:hypothetical protein